MPVAAVFGSARVAPGDDEYDAGLVTGRLLARAGWDVMTGGYDGVMAAVSRGAHEAGGHVIGVTVDAWAGVSRRNDWVVEERATADLLARLTELMTADGLIGLGGGVGTLVEVALSWNLRLKRHIDAPLVLVGARWQRVLPVLARELVLSEDDMSLVHVAPDPVTAVKLITAQARESV